MQSNFSNDDPIRLVIFGSAYGGATLIEAAVKQQIRSPVKLVAVVTDDPHSPKFHPERRLWRFPHTADEEVMVSRVCQKYKIECWADGIFSSSFEVRFRTWAPDLCLMATFGQIIPEQIFSTPAIGFLNLHHSSGDKWPDFPGPNPIGDMQAAGLKQVAIAVHQITKKVDMGPLVGFTRKIPLLQTDNAFSLHRRSWQSLKDDICDIINAYINKILQHEVSGSPS